MATRKLNLTRDQLATFLKNQEQIKQFERLFQIADELAPIVGTDFEFAADGAQATANNAQAMIAMLSQDTAVSDSAFAAKLQLALDAIPRLAQALELLAQAPMAELGTMAPQNADNVNITGGKISGLDQSLPVASGGTGQSTFTNGQLLIGNTTGNTLNKATLTAGANITITNGTGSITIAVSGLGTMAFENTGASGTFVTADIPPQTVTVVNGIITSIV
jgi:hypothetical protein